MSEAFFGKPWTAWELNALVQRGLYSDEKVILPVWHGVDAERVRRFSASLADILALNSTAGVDQVAKQIWEIAAPAPTPDSAAPPSHVAPVINDEEVAEEVARALEAASEVFKARGGERPRITIFKMCPDGLVRVDTGEIRTDRARSATNPSSLIAYSSKLRKAITIGNTVAMNEAGFTPRRRDTMYIRSVMAVPIFGRDGSVVGALELDSLTPHFFDDESKALGEAVAFLLSPFVQSAKVDS